MNAISLLWVAAAPFLALGSASAQTALSARTNAKPAVAWIQKAAEKEAGIIADDGTFPVRYTLHRSDSRSASVRAVLESKQGTVSRTLRKDGRPLTADENAAERKRLQEILDDIPSWEKKQKRNTTARTYATSLVQLMPQAMIWSYAPGQPQAQVSVPGPQVVLDFEPNPDFRPPTLASELLTGLAGRMWIDVRTNVLVRVEGRVTKPVNFGWGGILARFYPGGTVVFEQASAGDNRWVYSHLDERVTVRELLIRTRDEHAEMDISDMHLLAHPVDVEEAVRMLLALPDPH